MSFQNLFDKIWQKGFVDQADHVMLALPTEEKAYNKNDKPLILLSAVCHFIRQALYRVPS